MLRDGDLLHVRTFLQKCISRVDVMTNRHGAGTATRYTLRGGEIHFASVSTARKGETYPASG